jgi:hypothetical protein
MRAQRSPLLAILAISSTLCVAAAFTAPLSSGSLFRSAGRVPTGLAVSPRRPSSSSRIVPLLSSKASAEPIAIASSSVSDSLYAVSLSLSLSLSLVLAKPRSESSGSGTHPVLPYCPVTQARASDVSCRTRMMRRGLKKFLPPFPVPAVQYALQPRGRILLKLRGALCCQGRLH